MAASDGCGTVFKVTPGGALTTLYSFCSQTSLEGACLDGQLPSALIQAADGNFYGTTITGGANACPYSDYTGCGTVFKITPSGTLTTLYNFCPQSGCPDGAFPPAGLVQAANGDLYGTTTVGGGSDGCGGDEGCGTVFKIAPSGTLTTLYSFCPHSGCVDGAFPSSELVRAVDGDFYGTTSSAGAICCNGGTVFSINPSGALTTRHTFCSEGGECGDGEKSNALVLAPDGNFYGTTQSGGPHGGGTLFTMTPKGTLKTLYGFCARRSCTDGSTPQAGLVQATNGNFYGTTYYGGAAQCPSDFGCGTVFKITPSGVLTTLYSFCSQNGCADGEGPNAGLVQAPNGNLYGTTSGGGGNADGGGTVFKITPGGTLTTLYRFCSQSGCPDGSSPSAALVQAANGDFFGTTLNGGAGNGGTVFRITPSGRLATLHTFNPRESPLGALVQAGNGNFYGTTYYGGPNRDGTVFKITTGGQLTTIYTFCSQSHCTDGANPTAGLVQASDGDFYGTTGFGGASDAGRAGTVFKITPSGVLTTLYSLCSQDGCTDGENPLAGLFQGTKSTDLPGRGGLLRSNGETG